MPRQIIKSFKAPHKKKALFVMKIGHYISKIHHKTGLKIMLKAIDILNKEVSVVFNSVKNENM